MRPSLGYLGWGLLLVGGVLGFLLVDGLLEREQQMRAGVADLQSRLNIVKAQNADLDGELSSTRARLEETGVELSEVRLRAEQLEARLARQPAPCPLPDPAGVVDKITELFAATVGREPSQAEVGELVKMQNELFLHACNAQRADAAASTPASEPVTSGPSQPGQ